MARRVTDPHAEHASSKSNQDEEILSVEVVLALGAIMFGSGSSTNHVEQAMRSTATAIGLTRATAIVSFNTISLSYFPGPAAQPITAVSLVAQRRDDYRRLSAATTLASNLRSGIIDLRQTGAELDRISGSDMKASNAGWPGGGGDIARNCRPHPYR